MGTHKPREIESATARKKLAARVRATVAAQ